MILSKERAAVRNATRVIRDLVLRPGRELAGGGLSGGLGAIAMLAVAPLRQLPELAAHVPGTLRDLGERVTAIPGNRRRAPALAFAAQALAGGLRQGATMRERYLNLLSAAMDSDKAARVHPAFLAVLRQLVSDEVRIVSQFQHDGPYPLVSVVARYRFGGPIATELRNFSLLAGQAGCEHPERAPLYLDNLVRLGLAEMRPVRVADDTRSFAALEASPEVKAAVARVEARPPLETASADDGEDRVVADLQRRALYVTSFGRQFYEACEYRPETPR
jgi:abortive infection alpha-like protein